MTDILDYEPIIAVVENGELVILRDLTIASRPDFRPNNTELHVSVRAAGNFLALFYPVTVSEVGRDGYPVTETRLSFFPLAKIMQGGNVAGRPDGEKETMTLKPRRTFSLAGAFMTLQDFSWYGRRAVVLTAPFFLPKVYDVKTGKVSNLGKGVATCCAIWGNLVATGHDVKGIRLWDLKTKKNTSTKQGDENPTTMVFLPSGLLAVGSLQRNVKIWSTTRGHLRLVRDVGPFRDKIHKIGQVSPRYGDLSYVVTNDGDISVWDFASGRMMGTVLRSGEYQPTVEHLGHTVYTSAETVRKWRDGKKVGERLTVQSLAVLGPNRSKEETVLMRVRVLSLFSGLLMRDLAGLVARYV